MSNINRVSVILGDVRYYLDEFRDISSEDDYDLEERKTYYAVSMILFTILNSVIELGEELITEKNLVVPGSYREIFRLLGKADIVPKDLAKDLSSLVYYRNRLSHQYSGFNEDDLESVISKLAVIEEFMSCAEKELIS
ncbi:type VII toxin-antitoxin system HepT family RNase toxin [Methanoplanus endosymbiosus]|uniref:DUF86 domain-containing protein n=1 Tax=Methanoplanus endosymbiosus TaxID=33865 RepID=A0A9E7TJ41_9EURY|nr:DUF86 domain-containing protein [Methanoplanus endosymbiosus]UUX91365.1 DUF86 domain-containing protein [Methanoplanus endosymbiosus]